MTIVIVAGALANKCYNGGEAWVRLSWVFGLKKLGFQVYFWEQITPETCVDASGKPTAFETCLNRAYFERVSRQFGVADQAALICGNDQVHGATLTELKSIAASAVAVFNISGHLSHPSLLPAIYRRVYLDIDPGFTQFWHSQGRLGRQLDDHTHHFTIGENIGKPCCPIPTAGVSWKSTRQPVVLEDWPVLKPPVDRRFTTIASWRGAFGAIQHGEKTYGLKVHQFRKFARFPQFSSLPCELALAIHPSDRRDIEMLERQGWRLVDPQNVAADPLSFRQYVQNSAAEFSAAQGIYVETRSGWFSDRSVRYLASGRPVLVQDTGFGEQLPTGEGLLSFTTLDEAVAGAERIARNYESHADAARQIAQRYFDSNEVLGQLVDQLSIHP